MADPQPTAAGAIIALFIVVGAIAGTVLGQVAAGMIGGVAVGTAVAVLLWLRERRRIGR